MNKETLSYLYKLGMLNSNEDELEKMTFDLDVLIKSCVAVPGIEARYDPLADNRNIGLADLRIDQKKPSMDTSKLRSSAAVGSNCFVVPKVIE